MASHSLSNAQSVLAGAGGPEAAPLTGEPHKAGKKHNMSWQDHVRAMIDGSVFTTVMTIITLYALFGDDIKLAVMPVEADILFVVFSSAAFFLFLQELLLQCMVKAGYLTLPECKREYMNRKDWTKLVQFGSFYFWLDVIATASLVPEIPWMVDTSTTETDVSNNGVSTARAARPARAGAKAGRIFRIVRMVRLVRVIKVYKYYRDASIRKAEHKALERQIEDAMARGDTERAMDLQAQAMDNEHAASTKKESRVGAALSDLTTRRVIVGILLMLICIPLLTPTVVDESDDFAVQMLQRYAVENYANPTYYAQSYNQALAQFKESRTNVVYLVVNGTVEVDEDRSQLRDEDMEKLVAKNEVDGVEVATIAWFDEKFVTQESADWNLLLTTSVIIVLATSAMMFNHDANRLVLNPISRLVEVVTKISENPLQPLDDEDMTEFKEGMETTLLLITIKKIGGLLRVGFGEAGAVIISGNLNESAELDPCKPGKRIYGIFGFCDIRKFTDTTECLQEYVMLFVNLMADLVHGTVAQHRGAANKNIGDAFLLAWKFRDDTTLEVLNDESWRPRQTRKQQPPDHVQLADMSLMALLKVIAETERSDIIGKLDIRSKRARKAVMGRLFGRMPGYRVRMGFGLHWGWAIEGAIGSDKKIDASYLSPHVKMSERLEGATKIYGVPLLFTGQFHKILSTRAQHYCRQVDHCRIPAMSEPMDLYTYDCNMDADFTRIPAVSAAAKKKKKRHSRTEAAPPVSKEEGEAAANADDMEGGAVHHSKKKRWEHSYKYAESDWDTNWDLRYMQHQFSNSTFRNKFAQGLKLFLGTLNPVGTRTITLKPKHHKGLPGEKKQQPIVKTVIIPDWATARRVLLELDEQQEAFGGDGPSQFLLSVMKEEMNTPPERWDGTHFVDI